MPVGARGEVNRAVSSVVRFAAKRGVNPAPTVAVKAVVNNAARVVVVKVVATTAETPRRWTPQRPPNW